MTVTRSFKRARKKSSEKDIMQDRIQVIRNNRIVDPNEAVVVLQASGLASKNYSRECAAVDIWYVFDRKRKNTVRIDSVCEVSEEPYTVLMLFVVISALEDVFSARPCDLGQWRIDYPPGSAGEHCISSHHICSTYAKDYLLGIDPKLERCLNLREGFIRELVYEFQRNNPICSSTSS